MLPLSMSVKKPLFDILKCVYVWTMQVHYVHKQGDSDSFYNISSKKTRVGLVYQVKLYHLVKVTMSTLIAV